MISLNSHASPQARRLRSDRLALERLREQSTIFRFQPLASPLQGYLLTFHGRGLARVQGRVVTRDFHEVEVRLGASYPRAMPELRWLSPVYHPNISEIGLICLGGYGTHWAPSLQLDELCVMLWDMLRFHNFDVRSPYNRDAALWAGQQVTFPFPTDPRPLRDVGAVAVRPGDLPTVTLEPAPAPPTPAGPTHPEVLARPAAEPPADVVFLD